MKQMCVNEKRDILTMIFPTSRIDAAIPEKLDPEGAEGSGRGAECGPTATVWGNLGTSAGKCFERHRTRPLIMGLRAL